MVSNANKRNVTRLIASILIGFGLSLLTFNLGQWQTGRAQEKLQVLEKQQAALEAAPLTPTVADLPMPDQAFRRLEVTGRWVSDSVVYIDNRQVNGKPAVQVIQGLSPTGKDFVIPVDRGLLLRNPAEPRRAPDLPSQAASLESIRLQATILPHFARSAELRGLMLEDVDQILKEDNNGYRVWSNFNLKDYRAVVSMPVTNFVATLQPVLFKNEQDNKTQLQNGFYLNAVKLPEQVAKHKGYAFQWYTMTLVLILLSGWFVYREYFQRPKKAIEKENENE